MQKISIEKIRAVLLYVDGDKSAKEICEMYDIPTRTFRRWVSVYGKDGMDKLRSGRRGPTKGTNSISKRLQQKIIRFKQKNPSWGARRIKYQYDLQCHWRTVHRVIRSNGMLVKIKPKTQPVKRFQRRYVDSMWQCDTFQFRISGT
ncbi:MAG: helix-turn-helix domain containing protein [Thaumarchaeota archaeon]|nr:helix-turn-helix domain containing protein [Nitrososphaerota archaeon]